MLLFVELFNPPLLKSSEIECIIFQLISFKAVAEVS